MWEEEREGMVSSFVLHAGELCELVCFSVKRIKGAQGCTG